MRQIAGVMPVPEPIKFGFNVPFHEAIAAMTARGVVLPDVYYGVLQGIARQKAFSIAGITALDQLTAVSDSLKQYMAEGGSFNNWQKEQAVVDLGLSKARLDNIWRTNLQGQYMTGKWEQFNRNAKTSPFLMYDAINDSRVRPSHLALDGIIRPVGDAFWATHSPPCGYRCRCSLISLSPKQAQDRSKDGKGLTQQPLLKDGSPALPDKGWDYDKTNRMAGIDKAISEKLDKAPTVLKSVFEKQQQAKMNNPIAPYRQEWQKDFPKVILNAPLGDAAKHPDYQAAKSGDFTAATRLVSDLISKDALAKLADVIAEKKPLLIPVHAEEAISVNQIPLAYAVAIGLEFNLPIEFNIVQSAKVSRTGSDGFARLAFPPPFAGFPSQEAKHAIIFDDTLTQGGTLANLRGYVSQFGIETLAATTLTGKNYSSVLAITAATLEELKGKYHELEQWWVSYFGYGFASLTESEARYIINSKADADAIRNRIIAEKQKGFDGAND